MVQKTVRFVLEHDRFKILASGRTDAMVSACDMAVELFVQESIDEQDFLKAFDHNLPPDIRANSIRKISKDFNVIQNAKRKKYGYFFSFGRKAHPFSAALIATFRENLDIKLMQEGAKLFEGNHDFRKYCTRPSANTITQRQIIRSEVIPNEQFIANFFPKTSYVYEVESAGFMRNQVRLMMGQLVLLGRQEIDLQQLKRSLIQSEGEHLHYIAPASGLMLLSLDYEKEELGQDSKSS